MNIKLIERNGYIFQVDPENKNRRFNILSKPKTAKAPKPLAPTPTPMALDEDVEQKDRDRRRQRIASAGRQGTILTEGAPLGGSASLLGRST